MRSETQAYLDKAQKSLVKAGAELEAASLLPLLAEDAARNAYYAAFHAAQALIQERTAKNLKTHNGVHAEFHRLTRDDPSIDPSLRTFLSQAYEFKAIADYETASGNSVSAADAQAALAEAEEFVRVIAGVLALP